MKEKCKRNFKCDKDKEAQIFSIYRYLFYTSN